MNTNYILIVLGEPYSVFSEIIGKYFSKYKKHKKKVILIGNIKLLKSQLKKLDYRITLKEIKDYKQAKIGHINIINIKFNYKAVFDKITSSSNKYINDSFFKSLDIINKSKNKCILINGPVSKKTFLNKKYLGITEYLATKTKTKNEVMLIYNNKFSVLPLTTHIPLKYVAKKITKRKIVKSILLLNNFYKKISKKDPKIAVLGLNPHCETIDDFSEEDKIINPSINILKKKKIKIYGPFPADTFFLKQNIKKFNTVVGMYHDQVLTPIKTIFEFDAINITLGLPFIRISPDHGPNSNMVGKNLSNPSSFAYSMKFAENLD